MNDNKDAPLLRRFVRVPVTLQIKFAGLDDLAAMIRASTLNLSLGGMFICTEKVKPVGQRVEIELPLKEGPPLRIKGVVRHIHTLDGQPHGLGIEFDDLSPEARGVIENLLLKTAPPSAEPTDPSSDPPPPS
jgi:uncharacterized protein (TIGR02266 family)